jgi:ribosome maturation factor RimP
MSVVAKIESEIAPLVCDMGYDIVRVAVINHAQKQILQIMVERLDESAVTIVDCEKVSRAVSVCLDVMNPLERRYSLEISSPGIDRPLVKPKDFIKYCGKHISVKTLAAKDGRKTFSGLLENASESGIRLRLNSSPPDSCDVLELLYDEIGSAHID